MLHLMQVGPAHSDAIGLRPASVLLALEQYPRSAERATHLLHLLLVVRVVHARGRFVDEALLVQKQAQAHYP